MTKSDVDEMLAALYLRLNGYFTTGLIVHSPEWGQAGTEFDCLAIRHRHHVQADREVGTSSFLAPPEDATDLIVCEVKSNADHIGFNQSVQNDPELLGGMLSWSGLFEGAECSRVAEQLRPLLGESVTLDAAKKGVMVGECRIRGLLCCPSASLADIGGRWCLESSEILGFAHQCFNPENRRDTCSTRYNFQQWSYAFSPLVKFLKDPEHREAPSLESVYRAVGAA